MPKGRGPQGGVIPGGDVNRAITTAALWPAIQGLAIQAGGRG